MLIQPNGVAVRATAAKEPLFSFGVIADVQYADIPDGRSFLGVPRYYRHSITVLQRAVRTWNAHNHVRFCVNFGDIVDGFCPKDRSLPAVQAVVAEMPSSSGRAYYDFSPFPGYRFVILDAYDFSAVGWPRDHPVAAAARRFLEERNPNPDKNSPSGLAGVDRRFVMFNGAVGDAQLRWLDAVLREAARRRETVVVCSHLPLHPGAASPSGLMWNYEEVMRVVHRHGCVAACLAGHDHKGGYGVDDGRVHHRTLEAALECPPGTDAFGRVDVYPDRMVLVGAGRMGSTDMSLHSPVTEPS
ncbi:hypothetical protein E2562_007227 [Oryza meyeriana var. granulata]|uniref:Uncharacterized protein n=1 Tax=Oryza meyeriana var. granulata TaxID=110450 RepID=A0A6G1CCN7_9ORYZ|nr:hypothetical protein E2562_007227 [Oryza meyeriana var. granulata]